MIRSIKNNYVIAIITLIYCVFIGVICSTNYSFSVIAINSFMVLFTITLNVIISSIFLLAIDTFIRQNKLFKVRFFELTKAMWGSQLILFPISLIMVILIPFIKLDPETIIKIITFALKYVCPFALFFFYKIITHSDWDKTIEVVSITFIITSFITYIFHLI